MRFLCLMPTYGRPRLVESAIAMFEAQEYPAENRHLLILDDAGQLPSGNGDGWTVISTPDRFPSLTAKYQAMMVAEGWPDQFEWDAVALMDDDDIYGPLWLDSHAQALQKSAWSHPRQVWSLHRPPATSPTEPGLESSGGRFWAAAAVSADLLLRTGGFHIITRATFDQEHLAVWRAGSGEPGRPDDSAQPQYVYGWGRAPRHVSLEMGDRTGWYDSYAARLKAAPLVVPQALESRMDYQTRAIYEVCWSVRSDPRYRRRDSRSE